MSSLHAHHFIPSVTPYFSSPPILLYKGDAAEILSTLEAHSIDCIITSPASYGQWSRDSGDQAGLEAHPQLYIDKLVAAFHQARRVLKPTGSLWVHIGDAYWSGKRKSPGKDSQQKYRRIHRPQDGTGGRPWCAPKQLLLIPHRIAIAMQNDGWIVRNDNVWYNPAATSDSVNDRCALAHEYVFHFVKQRRYYFDTEAVAIPSHGKRPTKTPPSVWVIPTSPSHEPDPAAILEQPLALPMKATCPPGGVLLDPFCGSAAALTMGLSSHQELSVIGIDMSEEALKEARDLLVSQRLASR